MNWRRKVHTYAYTHYIANFIQIIHTFMKIPKGLCRGSISVIMNQISDSTINLQSILCTLRRVKKLHELTLDKGLKEQRVFLCHKLLRGLYYEPWFWNCK
ncbi:hypothetical protein AAZV13_03G098150 [Glycine max]